MKIKETIERECCNAEKGDLQKYLGFTRPDGLKVEYFCKYCGQHWITNIYEKTTNCFGARLKRV